jgi:glycosyltransferase involved in cell wall biosynthesis
LASIGRLLGWKGFSLGLAAFAAFSKEFPDSEYWIIGDGPERRRLEEQARRLGCAEKVRFLGWIPRCKLMEALSEVDVLVHPSLHEQFGYVVLEAMAAGRPVVCLEAGGCGKLVAEAGGTTIPMSTPEQVVSALCDALLELARNPARRLRRGRQARGWVTEMWNWNRVGERLATVYQEVSQRAKTGRSVDLAESAGARICRIGSSTD